jgi:hypothetical protein
MKTLNGLMLAGVLAAVLGASPSAHAGTATGYSRPVDIWLLSTMLSHTYENYTGWWAPGGYNGTYTASFGGDPSGGTVRESGPGNSDSAEWNCILNHGTDLTYLTTGVCHQGTNRGLYQTPIDWVRNWGMVDGSGVSYSMFYDLGSWFPFGPSDSAPC